jgi:prepilin peptidase CpaA
MVEMESSVAILVAFVVVSIAVGIVMLADMVKRRISNWVWVSFILGGLLFHVLSQTGQGLQFGLVGAFLGFGLLFMPFLAGGIAARDLKLTAGVGAWLGPSLTIWVLVCIATVAGLYYALAFLNPNRLKDSLEKLRILYCRLTCLIHYLAADESQDNSAATDLDETLVSYTTVVFVSTLLLLGVIVVFWT